MLTRLLGLLLTTCRRRYVTRHCVVLTFRPTVSDTGQFNRLVYIHTDTDLHLHYVFDAVPRTSSSSERTPTDTCSMDDSVKIVIFTVTWNKEFSKVASLLM